MKLSKEQKELITEAIEWWMEELKENSTFELPNTEKYYKYEDILDQINK